MMPESELNAESNSIIFTNGSGINGRNYANYIAGKLNVRVLNNNGGTTYNCGNNVYIGELQGSSRGSTFINNGLPFLILYPNLMEMSLLVVYIVLMTRVCSMWLIIVV